MSDIGPSRRREKGALAHGAFLVLWLAATTSYIGTFVQDIAERWLILDLTGTPLPSAMLSTTTVTASLFGMLPAGILADRTKDRRTLVIGSQIAMALPAAVVAVLAATHHVTPAVLLVAAAFLGLGMSLGSPAWYALLSDILPRELIADAVALNAVSYNIARAVGPAIGGVVLEGAGAPVSFAANAASFLVVIAAALAIRVPARTRKDAPADLRAAVREPIALVVKDARVRSAMIGMTFFTAGASIVYALAPAYGKITLAASAREYGVMIGAMGAGAVLGAWLLKGLRQRIEPRVLVAGTMATYGVCAIALSRVEHVGAAIAIFLPAGVGWIGSFSSLAALTQVWAPDAVRARMIAVYSMVHLAVWGVGATAGGAIADKVSVRAAILVGGIVCVVASVVTSRLRLPESFAGLPASLPPPPPDLDGPSSVR